MNKAQLGGAAILVLASVGFAQADDLSCVSDTNLQAIGKIENFSTAQMNSGSGSQQGSSQSVPGQAGGGGADTGQPRAAREGRAAEGAPSGQQGGNQGNAQQQQGAPGSNQQRQ